MDFNRLVYCSRNVLESRGEALAADLKLILGSAIRNNTAFAVTGCLVFSRGHFVQVLEGSPLAVARTFSRIMLDPRHSDITVIETKPIAARSFAAWSMGYAGSATLFDALSASAAVGGVIDPARISADHLVASMLDLVRGETPMISTPPVAKAPSAARPDATLPAQAEAGAGTPVAPQRTSTRSTISA